MYVLDSSALIELINDLPLSKKITDVVGYEKMITTSICVHEILCGAKTEKERFVFRGLFSLANVLDHNMNTAVIGSRIYSDLRDKGRIMNSMVLLIAAICKENNGTLITLDKKFKNIPDFSVVIVG